MDTYNKKEHLIIGLGEIGKALQTILECDGIDKTDGNSDDYRILHICFPWSDEFVNEVKKYVEMYKPEIVVVHSTVPVGTCDPNGWVHSPVRGVHPELEKGIRTFVKYFGGNKAGEVSYIFAKLGIRVETALRAKHTEALKLWDTTQYGVMIALEKEIKEYCERNDVDFDLVYTNANQTYNHGYRRLDKENVNRPVLAHMPGKIGGHCVIPNAQLLDSPLAQYIVDVNDTFK